MEKGRRPLEQISTFVCRFNTCRRQYKLRHQLSHHMKSHKGCPSKRRKSSTLCQKRITYNKIKKHQENCKRCIRIKEQKSMSMQINIQSSHFIQTQSSSSKFIQTFQKGVIEKKIIRKKPKVKVCCICFEPVRKRQNDLTNCETCIAIYHGSCIHKWWKVTKQTWFQAKCSSCKQYIFGNVN